MAKDAKDDRALFRWRGEFCSANGPQPGTRFVLLALSTWMKTGRLTCYPTQEQIAVYTGLSVRSIMRHLAMAERDGWISRRKFRKSSRQNWLSTEYTGTIPGEGGDNLSPPVAKVVTKTTEGGDKTGTKVVTQCHTNSQVTLNNSQPGEPAVDLKIDAGRDNRPVPKNSGRLGAYRPSSNAIDWLSKKQPGQDLDRTLEAFKDAMQNRRLPLDLDAALREWAQRQA